MAICLARIGRSRFGVRLSFKSRPWVAFFVTAPGDQLCATRAVAAKARVARASSDELTRKLLACANASSAASLLHDTAEGAEAERRLRARPDVLTALFARLRSGGQPGVAAEVGAWALQRGLLRNEIHFNALIAIQERATLWQAAVFLLNDMPRSQLRLDVISFNAAIRACSRGARWEQVLELFDKMQLQRVEPNLVSYNSAISMGAKARLPNLALKMLEEARRAHHAPDVVTYNSVLSAHAAAGQAEEASALLATMSTELVAPDVVSYNSAVNACAKAGLPRHAFRLLAAMRKSRVSPDVVSLNSAISACSRGSRWGLALLLLRRPRTRTHHLNTFTYNSAIGACAEGGWWEGALLLVHQMSLSSVRLRPDVISLSSAIAACARAGQRRRAVELLAFMEQERLRPNLRSFVSAITACARDGDWRQAEELLERARRAGLTPDVASMNAVISAHAKVGRAEPALRLLAEISEVQLEPDVITFNSVISAMSKGGHWASAVALLGLMQEKALTPNVVSYSTAISACEKDGQWAYALALLSELRSSGFQPNVICCNAAVSACEKSGREREALELVQGMEESGPDPDAVTYNAALLAMSVARAWQESVSLLERRAARGFECGRLALTATLRALAVPGVPLQIAARALMHFEAGVAGVSRLDLEEAARILEGTLSEEALTVAGAPLERRDSPHELIALLSPDTSSDADQSLEADANALACELDAQGAGLAANLPEVRKDLRRLLQVADPLRYDAARLDPYGSVVDGTAGSSNDIDISLEVDLQRFRDAHPQDLRPHVLRGVVLRELRNSAAAASSTWLVKGAAFAAKVPTLSLSHIPSGCDVDLAINNSICVRKSEMLRDLGTYSSRRLVGIVKLWARRRMVYGKALGRLSGFAFAQMVVFVVQVVPVREEALAPLLRGFFAFYARHFDWAQECVTVALGRRTLKAAHRGVDHLCIEDCVERDVDLCASDLLFVENNRLRAELQRADDLLATGASLATLLTPADSAKD
eukprot:TRINITY_DN73715_c0_g1_i1.p1 TRINITY_DN73715_c0_g1~~TRINITY_DN73715_c0_g1_i1.p1  ORF type:complete len:1002 (-),score=186.01 TRINITY_DN73715_c0_g1_i1:71-3076(-)